MRRSLLSVLVVLLAACSRSMPQATVLPEVDAGVAASSDAGTQPPYRRTTLRWKRHRTLENDLAQALELPSGTVCSEVGGRPCATNGSISVTEFFEANGIPDPKATCAYLQGRATCDDQPIYELRAPKGLHTVSLGGSDPLLGELFEPLAEPGLTTPLAVDRMVLAACGERARRDAEGPAVVFTHLDLGADALASSSPGVREQVAVLYQRLLARDPLPEEVDAVASMLDGTPAMSAPQFARLACYAIATSTEFIFQ